MYMDLDEGSIIFIRTTNNDKYISLFDVDKQKVVGEVPKQFAIFYRPAIGDEYVALAPEELSSSRSYLVDCITQSYLYVTRSSKISISNRDDERFTEGCKPGAPHVGVSAVFRRFVNGDLVGKTYANTVFVVPKDFEVVVTNGVGNNINEKSTYVIERIDTENRKMMVSKSSNNESKSDKVLEEIQRHARNHDKSLLDVIGAIYNTAPDAVKKEDFTKVICDTWPIYKKWNTDSQKVLPSDAII